MSTAIDPIASLPTRRYLIPTDIVAAAGASRTITTLEPVRAPAHVADTVTLTHESKPVSRVPTVVAPAYGSTIGVKAAPLPQAASTPEAVPVGTVEAPKAPVSDSR